MIRNRFISARCFVVVVMVAVVVGVVALCTIVMLNNQAYTSMKPLHCLATGRSNARNNSKRCKIHLLFSYSFTYTSIISKSAHIKCSLSTLLDGLKMLSKVWVVLLLLCDSSLFVNHISKGYIFLFKYLFDI